MKEKRTLLWNLARVFKMAVLLVLARNSKQLDKSIIGRRCIFKLSFFSVEAMHSNRNHPVSRKSVSFLISPTRDDTVDGTKVERQNHLEMENRRQQKQQELVKQYLTSITAFKIYYKLTD